MYGAVDKFEKSLEEREIYAKFIVKNWKPKEGREKSFFFFAFLFHSFRMTQHYTFLLIFFLSISKICIHADCNQLPLYIYILYINI